MQSDAMGRVGRRILARGPLALLLGLCWMVLAEPARSSGVLVPRDGSPPIHVQSHRVQAVLEDGLARTTVRQTFFNPHSRALEAVYLFPLPDGAALVDLAMETGGQRLEGFLAERKTARRSYDSLVRRNIDPALVEQIGRAKFRLSVFPVLPKQPTVIELSWIEAVPMVEGEYRYVYPLALDGTATRTEQDLTVSLEVKSSAPIVEMSSPMPEMFTERTSAHTGRASLERSQALLSEDVVVVARVETAEPSLAVHVYRPPDASPFFAAVLTPPALRDEDVLPRDVSLALDVSGSMRGVKFEQARSAALWLLEHLRPKDRVNVILFRDVLSRFAAEPVPVTAENIAKLREFLNAAAAGGGTALGDAIAAACAAPKELGRSAMAVILTDGRPTVGEMRPKALMQDAREGADRGLRAYTFGVGSDVDSTLLEGVATAGGGRSEIFVAGAEVEGRLRRFLTRTSSPAISDLALRVDGQEVDDLLPRPLPEVYLGEQTLLCGRVATRGSQEVVVEGVYRGQPLRLHQTVDFDPPSESRGLGNPVARDLYARERLQYLAQALRLRTGLSDEAYFAAVDRGRYDTEDELVSSMIELSLETGVQCAYTALIALLPEDHARLNPRDAEALEAALDRARERKQELARVVNAELPDGSPGASSTEGELARGGEYRGPGDATPPGNPGGPGTRISGSGSSGFQIGRDGDRTTNSADSVPPNLGGGGDPTPPRSVGGPSGAMPPSTGRPTTGGFAGRRSRGGEGFERWEFWWEHNKERFLHDHGVAQPLSDAIRDALLPNLLECIAHDHPDLADSACIALARSAPPEAADDVLAALTRALLHPQPTVREAAVLGLGIYGDPRAISLLVPIARDEQLGRKLCGQAAVDERTRALSIYSLGMIGDPSTIETLIELSARSPGNHRDVVAASIHALGLYPGGHDRIVPFLAARLEHRALDRIARAQAPIALARLASRHGSEEAAATLPTLLAKFVDDATDSDLRRSLAIALGKISPTENTAVITALLDAVRRSNDDQTRHFSIIALAEIGARGDSGTSPDAHETIREALLQGTRMPKRIAHQPWWALGLAIYGLGPAARADGFTAQAAELLVESFERTGNPSYQAAMGVALGLLRHQPARGVLETTMLDTRNQPLKGYLVLAQAMLGDVHVEQLNAWVRVPGLEYKFRLQVARGLGLIGDRSSVEALTAVLRDAQTLSEMAACSQALSMIGGEAATLALIEALQDTETYPLARGFAALGLGRLAESGALPWNAAFSLDSNYRAKTPSLAEILDIL